MITTRSPRITPPSPWGPNGRPRLHLRPCCFVFRSCLNDRILCMTRERLYRRCDPTRTVIRSGITTTPVRYEEDLSPVPMHPKTHAMESDSFNRFCGRTIPIRCIDDNCPTPFTVQMDHVLKQLGVKTFPSRTRQGHTMRDEHPVFTHRKEITFDVRT